MTNLLDYIKSELDKIDLTKENTFAKTTLDKRGEILASDETKKLQLLHRKFVDEVKQLNYIIVNNLSTNLKGTISRHNTFLALEEAVHSLLNTSIMFHSPKLSLQTDFYQLNDDGTITFIEKPEDDVINNYVNYVKNNTNSLVVTDINHFASSETIQ